MFIRCTPGHADDRDRRGRHLLQDDAFTQDDQGPGLHLLHGLQPHVDLVGGVVGAGEVQHRLGAVLAQPGAQRAQDLVGLRREPPRPQVRHQQQDVQRAQDQGDADADEARALRVGDRADEQAHDGGEVEVEHLHRGVAEQQTRRGVRDAQPGGQVDVPGRDRHLTALVDQGDQRTVRSLEPEEHREARDRRVEHLVLGEAEPRQKQDQQQLTDQEAGGHTGPHLDQQADEATVLVVEIEVRQVRHGGRGGEGGGARDERGRHETGIAQHHEDRRGQLGRAAHPGDANSSGYHGETCSGRGPVRSAKKSGKSFVKISEALRIQASVNSP